MSELKKPRGDAKLKTLPPERQEAIVEYLREHTLKQTRDWLAADGLSTSLAALSDFFSWYQLGRVFERYGSNSLAVVNLLKQENPKISEQELQEIGNRLFQMQAIQNENLPHYVKIVSARHKATVDAAKLALKREELDLARAKFQRETCELFLKWSEDQRAKNIAASHSGNADKIEALGQLMFGELWRAK